MANCCCNGFWEGGEDAWWHGLADAMQTARKRLDDARRDDEHRTAQDEIDRLDAERADATTNSDRWLF